MHICIYEDESCMNLEPLIYSRPVYELVCGMSSLKDKIKRAFPGSKIILHCRKYLEEIVKSENPDCLVNEFPSEKIIFINGRIVAQNNLKKILKNDPENDTAFVSDEKIIAASVSGDNLKKLKDNISDVIKSDVFNNLSSKNVEEVNIANYLWDLIYMNGEEIRNDFKLLVKKKKPANKKYSNVSFVNKKQIYIGKNVEIKPGVVLDASEGPVFIEKNVMISSNAVIQGPVYIGESSKIKTGASIYPNVSIGKVCKVGGEVEDSIIMPFTNKQHPGFLGHSYLGSWINIGADTNCSDLQNNYATVKVQVNGRHIDSGKQFVGLLMGDHSKTAINTMFNTGTVVGFSCNVFGAGFPPKYIPSFSWGGNESMHGYKLMKAIETAKAVFTRREKEFKRVDEELFEYIFNATTEDRTKRGF